MSKITPFELDMLYTANKDNLKSIIKALEKTDNTDRDLYNIVISNIFWDALKNNNDFFVEYLLQNYKDNISLLNSYQKSLDSDLPMITKMILNMGFIPPKHTVGKRICEIIRLDCSDMTAKDKLQLWKNLEYRQEDYFMYHPLKKECNSDSDFFLVAFDGENICGSMYVLLKHNPEDESDKAYFIELFATRTLMDPAYSGVGKAMINYLKNEAKKNRIQYISLISLPNSLGFYKHMGFQQIGNSSDMYYKVY